MIAHEAGGLARIENIAPIVRRWLDRAAIIATDELPAYPAVGRALAGHIRVNHSADEFARDDLRTGRRAHVNTAESLHALLKRAVIGVWHWISEKHLVRYLAETMFHGNHRGAFETGFIRFDPVTVRCRSR
ncbi:MAG: transposase [Alphaproteobacteria bacterium]|nr:transposase [Alphaproteobacteria bacterium]